MTANDLARRVAHGLSYPFNPPGKSYLFRDGRMQPLGSFDIADRVPVVASGSNGSPQRLAEKYGDQYRNAPENEWLAIFRAEAVEKMMDMIKADPRLAEMVLVKNSRLSVQPVTEAEWGIVCEMASVSP